MVKFPRQNRSDLVERDYIITFVGDEHRDTAGPGEITVLLATEEQTLSNIISGYYPQQRTTA